MRKITILSALVVFSLVLIPLARAADKNANGTLPSKFTLLVEKINLALFTYRAPSKVKTLDRYADRRVKNVETVYSAQDYDRIKEYASSYGDFKIKGLQIIEQKKIKGEVVETVKTSTIEQQKTLSVVRDGLEAEDIKKDISKVQEDVVNKTKDVITNVENKENASKFVDKAVTVWEDPKGLKGDQAYANGTTAGEGVHTYAAGTTAGGVDGAVVDGGQAKVVQGSGGNVKIVYAPGTGPNSVTKDDGKKVWVVQGSGGSTTQSSGQGGNVVQGDGSGSGSGTNTVSGQSGSSGSGQTVIGGDQGQGGTTVVEPD